MDIGRLEEAVRTLADAVGQLCEKVDWHDQMLDQMTSGKLMERVEGIEKEFGSMVGGLNDIIDGRRKREYADGFREKHPEFGRYEGIGKRFGLDIYGMAADNTYGKSDEEAEGVVMAMLNELKEKFDDLLPALEKLAQHEASETPAEEAAEHEPEKGEKEITVEIEKGPPAAIIEEARRFRGSRAG